MIQTPLSKLYLHKLPLGTSRIILNFEQELWGKYSNRSSAPCCFDPVGSPVPSFFEDFYITSSKSVTSSDQGWITIPPLGSPVPQSSLQYNSCADIYVNVNLLLLTMSCMVLNGSFHLLMA